MLYDGKYLTDDEFLSHFRMDKSCVIQLNRLVEDNQEFRSVSGKMGKRSSMLHIMVLLKFLGNYGAAAALLGRHAVFKTTVSGQIVRSI